MRPRRANSDYCKRIYKNISDFEMLNKTNNSVMEKGVDVIYDISEDTKIREAEKRGEVNGMEKVIAKMKASGMSEEEINNILTKEV